MSTPTKPPENGAGPRGLRHNRTRQNGLRQNGLRQNGQWVVTLNQLAVLAVIVIVVILLTIAALMAGTAQTALPLGSAPGDTTSAEALGEKYSNSTATKQVLAGFGLFSFWIIGGAFSIARSRGSREFRFGTPTESRGGAD